MCCNEEDNYDPVPAAGAGQVFRYVADGTEPNPFPVALPTALTSVNYNVQISWGGPSTNAIKSFNALVSSFTVNGFDVLAGSAPEVDDILMITVQELT